MKYEMEIETDEMAQKIGMYISALINTFVLMGMGNRIPSTLNQIPSEFGFVMTSLAAMFGENQTMNFFSGGNPMFNMPNGNYSGYGQQGMQTPPPNWGIPPQPQFGGAYNFQAPVLYQLGNMRERMALKNFFDDPEIQAKLKAHVEESALMILKKEAFKPAASSEESERPRGRKTRS